MKDIVTPNGLAEEIREHIYLGTAIESDANLARRVKQAIFEGARDVLAARLTRGMPGHVIRLED